MDQGAHYQAAHYGHAITETAPGHATLFTGASPREHGIIGNEWFDASSGLKVYNTEDDRFRILGQEKRAGTGTSPKNLLASTTLDELVLASGGRSKAFAVSVKDRGAILPAGHLGKAFWYSGSTGEFVTSDYYYEEYPDWAQAWNESGVVASYLGKSWELLRDKSEYLRADQDDRACERAYMHLGRTFPHPLSDSSGGGLSKALRYTPMGDELVLSFAMELVRAEGLGQDEVADFLAVSFSATDYVGHAFGPLSLESEDNLLRLDATLETFFTFLDQQVGLDQVLIVLSADHGAPDCPEHLASLGRDVGWVDSTELIKNANGALKRHFDLEEDLLRAHVTPYLWLDHAKLKTLGIDAVEAAEVAARGALQTRGLARAIPRSELSTAALPDSALNDRVRAAFHSKRSGDVYLVPEQQWLIGVGNASDFLASLHGSPWSYDTYVPILLAGPGVKAGEYLRSVSPRDIAPTLANVLGIKPPSSATGSILHEALGD